ncbi:DinB family protein [Ekhidna sp.]|uniref:DinB family protein n=1 Tax=Ekhidna sp. TaxID=2608089 RepID=UPI003CCBA9B8
MKKITIPLLCLIWSISCLGQNPISSEERKSAINHLKTSQNELLNLLDGLSEEQINYRPGNGEWTIYECLEHIAISEKNLMGMVQMSLKENPDPRKQDDVAMSDEQLLALITSRDQKVKTREEFEPTDSFGGFNETLKTFKDRRKANIKFVKSTDKSLRNYYMQFPFGIIDSYQGVLFMSGHTQRHAGQIKEIIESEGFPG